MIAQILPLHIAVQKNIPFIKKLMGDTPDETAFIKWKIISLLKKHEPDLLNRLMEIKDYKIIYKNQKYDMVSIK